MSKKFQNKYRIESTRLQNWNYGWNADYFVTIKTRDRKCYFGKIENNMMILSEIGEWVEFYWNEIPKHFLFVELGGFVVMPNHIHGIITINKSDPNAIPPSAKTRQCLASANNNDDNNKCINIGHDRCHNPGKNNLSSIVGSFKSIVTKTARKINPQFAWQSRFHDWIIWDLRSYGEFEHYIHNNPKNWK